ncbi:dTDP-4-dehydrorhamnose reductase [Ochrovirga pacifica]|uniref:dTDP-4-dehydrorhamnose reductase n=1 Tax=Ochrovirga pacifica TaxID=1042376 RepID=UPI0002557BE0|nr:dTDP-4-dehydrorhamnose reductase [Ochrovirga pacifica]
MSNILITGSDGQLGCELKWLASNYPQHRFYFTTRKEVDICYPEQIAAFCQEHQIENIINCAAYTKVDRAESEKEICYLVNATAVKNLGLIAKKMNIQLTHLSTDYVFDGQKKEPYKENESTHPINIYGKSKQIGEQYLLDINPKNCIIIRTAWVYSSAGNNFVKSMLRLSEKNQELKIVCDQIGTPTYAGDLAQMLLDLLPKIKNTNTAIYHYTHMGSASWFEFAKEIFKQAHNSCRVKPIATANYPTAAQRPLFTVLDKSKIITDFDLKIPHWKTALTVCLKKLST